MTSSFGLWDLLDIKDLSDTYKRQSQNYNDLSAVHTHRMIYVDQMKRSHELQCLVVPIEKKMLHIFPSWQGAFRLTRKTVLTLFFSFV